MIRKGADTGFFIRLKEDDSRAQVTWNEVRSGQTQLVVPVVTVTELLVWFYRHGVAQEGRDFIQTLQGLPNGVLVPISVEIATRAAGYRHGLGLATVDSLVLATSVVEPCSELITTDTDFKIVAKQNIITVTFW